MFEGKMFFGVTGTPIRKIAFVKSALALADPVPLTLANLTTKSFTLAFGTVRPSVSRKSCPFILSDVSSRSGVRPISS
jgi:hypothetical protein